MIGGAPLFLGIEGTALAAGERRVLARVRPGGIVLVSRNIGTEEELRALVAELRAILPEATFCLDAEGGRVDRLRRLAGAAPAAARLAEASPAFAARAGRLLGQALRHFDFDLDFAPVADLDHGIAGNALDERTYGSAPRAVVARARALVSGLHASGVGACLKHFPGLGRATADTHLTGAEIVASERELERDLAPFRALLPAVESAMVGHAVYPGWTEPVRPASLSPKISTKLLRSRLRYRGLLFSDDLEMGALARWGSLPELAGEALDAGCDALLFCRRIEEAPAIARALAPRASEPRFAAAQRRLAGLRRRLHARRQEAAPPLPLPAIRERFARLALALER